MEAKPLTFGSLFAGVGGFDLALTRAGMTGLYAAEMDAKCNSVRRRHWPDETQYTDVTFVGRGSRPDVVCAGWPCQGNSVAGKRGGMADGRSGLWSEVVRILGVQRPRWFLGENVPGILSVNGGEDWATVLADLGRLGYGFAYRILDAQWFGVPQRRRRVFIVGCLGDWRSAAEILFERESLPWDSPPRRETRTGVAASLTRGADSGGRGGYAGRRREEDVNLVSHSLTAGGFDASEDGTGRGTPLVAHALTACKTASGRMDPNGETFITCPLTGNPYGDHESRESLLIPFDTGQVTSKQNRSRCEPGDPCHTLPAHGHVPSIAYTIHGTDTNGKVASPDDVAQCLRTRAPGSTENSSTTVVAYQCQGSNVGPMGTLRAGNGNETGGVPFTAGQFGVRRLMPIECERLQGFPDDWTRYGADDEEMADSVRYRMCGNAVAVPCIEWIGRRLMEATQ